MLRLVRRGQPAASRRSQPAPRPGLACLCSPGAARAACVVRLGPCATLAQYPRRRRASPRTCLAVHRRREVSFVYPLRTAPSHPRCHTIRLARSTSDLCASHVLSCVSSRVVRAPFSACRVRSRRPFACSCTRVRSACYLRAVSRMLFAHTLFVRVNRYLHALSICCRLLTIERLQQFYLSADPVCLPSESPGSLGTKIAASIVSAASNCCKFREISDMFPSYLNRLNILIPNKTSI
jgi:hypothetical protein